MWQEVMFYTVIPPLPYTPHTVGWISGFWLFAPCLSVVFYNKDCAPGNFVIL